MSDDCDGWKDKLVGKIILDDEQETALSEGEYVRRKDLPKPSRVIPKNSMITMDFRPDRLNVHVDDRKKITGVNYG
ncbi:hypothetical protein CU098_009192 [Rhizopus stolonifer]|uniref:Uncharacterized protein n=1 Tax=Rhizopus stolonifer TaxID=4846 RepID=A0A367K370_RHIST|nr:hypothetical protein CU098_009192 [Rhizopus stolonifer]